MCNEYKEMGNNKKEANASQSLALGKDVRTFCMSVYRGIIRPCLHVNTPLSVTIDHDHSQTFLKQELTTVMWPAWLSNIEVKGQS